MRYATVGSVLAVVGVGVALLSGGGSIQARLLDGLEKRERAKTYRVVQHWATDGFDSKEVVKLYYSNGRVRRNLPDGRWTITDEATGTLTFVDPAARTFTVHKPDPVKFAARKNPRPYDPYSVLLAEAQKAVAAGDRTQALGVQVLNGRRLRAYKVTRDPVGNGTSTSTYWLDEKDDTLARYEVRNVPGRPAAVQPVPGGRPVAMPVTTPFTVTSEFSGFDEPLDEKLFDLTPPAGYKVEALEPTDGKPVPAAPPTPAKK